MVEEDDWDGVDTLLSVVECEAHRVYVEVREDVREGSGASEEPKDFEGVGDIDGVGDCVGLSVTLGVGVPLGVMLGVREGVGVGEEV